MQTNNEIAATVTYADVDITDDGKEYVVVDFRADSGLEVRWSGSLGTDKSVEFVRKVLRHIGWVGNDLLMLDSLIGKTAYIAPYEEEYNGKTYKKVAFPRMSAGGAGFASRASSDAKKALAARLKGAFTDGATPSPRPANGQPSRAAAPPPARPTTMSFGDEHEPGMDDDQIPFLSDSPMAKDIEHRRAQPRSGEALSYDQRRSRSPKKTPLPAGPRAHRPWTTAEQMFLRRQWGDMTLRTLVKHLRRSAFSIGWRAKMMGLGSPNQGRYTLRQLETKTGYARSTLLLAAKHLGITFSRARRARVSDDGEWRRPRYDYGVEEDELERVIAYLASKPDACRLLPAGQTPQGAWGGTTKPDACLDCGRSDRPHKTGGLCTACAQRAYWTRWQAERRGRAA